MGKLSQSLPNQVNDFNAAQVPCWYTTARCRNPFQTRSTTSICLWWWLRRWWGCCRNPFQTRSTTSITPRSSRRSTRRLCRNPFQTRSTTSILVLSDNGILIPKGSQSLPNQVNDFNSPLPAHFESKGLRRPGREPGFAGDFRPAIFQSIFF